MTTTAIKVLLEKAPRPEYEGGGMGYAVFVIAKREGEFVKFGSGSTSGIYSYMVEYAKKRAKQLKVPCDICPA